MYIKKKITFIGSSKKFISIAKSIYPDSYINIYYWRDLHTADRLDKKKGSMPDIIFVCGFDYQSYSYSFKKFYSVNITNPLNLIEEIATKKKTKIIYIDTYHCKCNFTLSRYVFAKKTLGNILSKKYPSLKVLHIPTIINSEEKADIQGGIITKIIFNYLIQKKIIEFISIDNLTILVRKCLKKTEKKKGCPVKPILLKLPRSMFIDRFLRFII